MENVKLTQDEKDNKTYYLNPTDEPFNYISDNKLTTFITPSSFNHFMDCQDIIKKYAKENNLIYIYTNPTIHFDQYPTVKYINSNKTINNWFLEIPKSIKNIPEMNNNHHKISFEVVPFAKHHSNKCYLYFECKNIIIK